MILPSKVRFCDTKVKDKFYKLCKQEKSMCANLNRAFKQIEENSFCGIQIPKRLIPKDYLKKYGIRNLWKYNLPSGWRLLYSIKSNQVMVVAIVIEWLKHKDYEGEFKY